MRTAKINVTKIDKTALFEGQSGKYLDLVFFENKNGEDQYGNMGFVTQDIGKERRLAGERGPIIGNWKETGPKPERPATVARQEVPPIDGDDDIPF